MKLKSFYKQMDELTASKTPYLFIIDFEKSNPLIIKLADLSNPSPLVKYSFPSITNVQEQPVLLNYGGNQSEEFFKTSPISFEVYNQKFELAQKMMKQLGSVHKVGDLTYG